MQARPIPWIIFLVLVADASNLIAENEGLGSANDARPRKESSAEIPLIGSVEDRSLTVHREAKSGPARAGALFFHKPVFAFEEMGKSKEEGLPRIIWDIEREPDLVSIQIRLVISTKRVRDLARIAVIEQDRALRVEQPEISESDVDVEPWPLTALKIKVHHAVTDVPLGKSVVRPIPGARRTVNVSLQIPADSFDYFLEQLKRDRVLFTPAYTFENVIVASAQSATRISGELSAAVSQALDSQLLDNQRGPIFQEDARKLRLSLSQTIIQTIRATDASMLASINLPDIASHIVSPQEVTFSDLEKPRNKELADAVSGYIKSTLGTIETEREKSRTTTRTQEKDDAVTLGPSAKKFFPDLSITKKDKDKLETQHGVKFTQAEARGTAEPHSILIHRVNRAWQSSFTDVMQSAYISVGRDKSFQVDSAFRASFTRALMEEKMTDIAAATAPFSVVRKGMAFCYFGKDVPPGYVLADGQSSFPDENWVPKHLRGNPVPDMRGMFAVGAGPVTQVGRVWRQGAATIPGATVPGDSFRLTSNEAVGVLKLSDGRTQIEQSEFLIGLWSSNLEDRLGYQVGLVDNRADLPSYDRGRPAVATGRRIARYNAIVGGAHAIPEQTIDLSDATTQPNNVSCRWILRMN